MKIVVYDLDGTISKINTFKAWIIFSFLYALVKFNIRDFFAMCKLISQRVSKKINRLTFKEKLLNLQKTDKWEGAGETFAVKVLPLFIRHEMMSHDKFEVRLLATAAPAIYVMPFIMKYSYFTDVVCSDFDEHGVFYETLANVKYDSVFKLLKDRTIDLFYTDHHDDIPLMEVACKTILVFPSVETINKISLASARISYELY